MKKGELRKQAILEQAEALFYQKGYTATTISDLIESLHCSKGSFYHHFDSKLQVLEDMTRESTRLAFAEYESSAPDDPLGRLNRMLYCAMPFRAGQEKAIAVMLPLAGAPESGVVEEKRFAAQAEWFFPEFVRLLTMCRSIGCVHYTHALLPRLTWDAYTALYRRLLMCAKGLWTGEGEVGDVREAIEAERFMLERLLDAPYGAMEIVRADEALSAIYHAINHVKAIGEAGAE